MQPIDFPEKTDVLNKPATMTDEECGSLPIYRDPRRTVCVSCWRPTWRERLSILFFGKIWVHVHSGVSQPPIALEGKRTIFEEVKTDG